MLQVVKFPGDLGWILTASMPDPPPDPGWFHWWYVAVWVTVWAAGVGITAKAVFDWDRIAQWNALQPLIWPIAMFVYVPNRLTARWLRWRDYRKNCKLKVRT